MDHVLFSYGISIGLGIGQPDGDHSDTTPGRLYKFGIMSVQVCVCECARVCMHACKYASVCVNVHECACMWVSMRVCRSMCECA